MFDHISVGVRDLECSRRFYDAALHPLSVSCLSAGADGLGYGRERAQFWLLPAAHPVQPDPQSGLHICFAAPNEERVDAFHAAACASGGNDNGVPGLRREYGAGYYAAFVLDPNGYRLEAYCDLDAAS
jgi:catechol 2,3-dioxygenase-like lactoylglutathione lyase family enzyme